MSNPQFVAYVMVPVIQTFDAPSVEHAQALIRQWVNTDLRQSCAEGTPQPYLHSLKVIPGEDEPEFPRAA